MRGVDLVRLKRPEPSRLEVVSATPAIAPPVAPTPEPTTPVTASPVAAPPVLTVADTGVPDNGTPETGTPFYVLPERKPRPWSSVQDAHSHGEHQVYQTLFRLAPGPPNANKRVVVGIGTLAPKVPMTYNNCQRALRSLASKLAIQDCGGRGNAGREYLVFCYEAIIGRRKAAGMTHILKSARGVTLCDEVGTPLAGTPTNGAGTPDKGPPDIETGTPDMAETGTPFTEGAIRNKKITQETTTTLKAIGDAIRRFVQPLDDDAVERIWTDCRERVPDVTAEEVAALAAIRAAAVRQQAMTGSMANPVGALITYVPADCSPRAVHEMRMRKAAEESEWAG